MPGDKHLSRMLTTSEVAQLLNVYINTVRRWSNQGIIKAYRLGPRGDRRFQAQDIASFLDGFRTDRQDGKLPQEEIGRESSQN